VPTASKSRRPIAGTVRSKILEEAKEQNKELRRERAERITVRVLVAPKAFKDLVKLARKFERTTQGMAEEILKMGIALYTDRQTPYGETHPMEALGLYRKGNGIMQPPVPPNPHDPTEMEAAAEERRRRALGGTWAGSDLGLPTTRRVPFRRPPASTEPPPEEAPEAEPAAEEEEFEIDEAQA
jgi:hypothetical protein